VPTPTASLVINATCNRNTTASAFQIRVNTAVLQRAVPMISLSVMMDQDAAIPAQYATTMHFDNVRPSSLQTA